jgi:hypothetical protein
VFGQSGKSVIVPNGNTNTTVSTAGKVTNISTGTLRGSNAFNAFTTFNEAAGTTVNLLLPNGATNLLNLVDSSATQIGGTLNSILNGKVGGNVFFADPFGVIVGKTGVVNVGAFSAMTPTSSFLSQFFVSPGNPSGVATNQMVTGTVPITPDGLISIQGKINAAQNVSLFGGSVTNSGAIASGAIFANNKPDFSDVVNIKGVQSGTTLSVQGGNIEILAAGDVQNAGVIATDGAANGNAGNIDIHAGGNVQLLTNSLVSASGNGLNSNGGKIKILADGNSELDQGATVIAGGGSSGNGGSVEFSAKGAAAMNGGILSAAATKGTAGTVLIDPATLTLTGNNVTSGSDVTYTADQSITVAPGAVISTRNIASSTDYLNGTSAGNSGNISITAPQISVGNGASILAHANNGYTPGDITMTATQTDAEATATATTGITIGNATLMGGDITLASTATAQANSSSFGAVAGLVNDTSLGILVNGPAAIYSSTSTSGITIGDPTTAGNAIVNGSGNIKITSTAASSTTSKLTGTSGLAYGNSESTATATVASNAKIQAAGTLELNAISNNNLDVSINSDQQAQSTVVVGFGKTKSVSATQVDGTIEGSNVQVGATNTNSFSTSASATDFNGTQSANGGAAVALGFYNSTATTTLTGKASATADTNDVSIGSSSTDALNVVNSSASVPSGNVKAKIASAEGNFLNFGNKLSQATISQFFSSSPTAPAVANASQLGIAAGVSVAQSFNTATTTVSGTVTANFGKATVSSLATDSPQISAQGAAGGQGTDLGGGVAISDFHNTADTYLSGNGIVTSQNAASITSEADIQNPGVQAGTIFANDWDLASNKYTPADASFWAGEYNLLKGTGDAIFHALSDVANPGSATTSFVNTGLSTSADASNGIGVAGSVNLMSLTNQSNASVTGSARVQSNAGDVNVTSTANLTTFNASGMAFGVGQVLTANPGVKSGSSAGGSYDGENITNTSTADVGDGAEALANGGNLNVKAATTTLAIAIVQAGDSATKFGIVGAANNVNVTDSSEAYIQSNATATASGDVNVTANNTLSDFAIGGAVGQGGSAQVGVAFNWNQISQTTLAYIGDPADQRGTICTGCGVLAGGNVNVTPTSDEHIYAITFAATKSGNAPSKAGAGANGESSSQPAGTTAPSASGSSNAAANNGAGGGSFGFGVSGEIAFNQVADLSNNPGIVTKGFINNGASVKANQFGTGTGAVNVMATDTSFSVAAGLAGAYGQTAALAGAYGQNTILKDVEATTDNATLSGNGLSLNALSNNSLYAVTAGGSVNTEEGFALAGSVNNNTVTNMVSATLGNNTSAVGIGSGGVTVNANEGVNGDQIISAAGGISASLGGAGIGAAIDLGTYTNNVTASIGKANLGSSGNVQVTSNTNVLFVPIAVALGIGSDFGADGSLAAEQITNTTASTAGSLFTNDNLLVGSTDSSTAIMVSGGVGAGGEVGVSVSGLIPIFHRTTTSQIASGANVTALGNGTAVNYDGQTASGILLDAQAQGGSSTLQDYAAAGAFSGSVSAAGAVIVNPVDSLKDDTEANIASNAIINGTNTGAAAKQSVTLLAGDNSGVRDVAGMLSVGGDLGVGVGLDDVTPSWTVNTSIGNGAQVNAANNVIASSNLSNSVSSYVVAVSASGGVSATGAVTLLNDTSHTNSYIDDGATVFANNNVQLAANRNTSLTVLDGAGAFSLFVGLNGAAANVSDNNTTQAYIGSANVTALAQGTGLSAPIDVAGLPGSGTVTGLSVTATATDSVPQIIAAGAAGSIAALSGSVLANTFNETTTAEIKSGASVNGSNNGAGAGQGVNLFASDISNSLTFGAGALAAGGVGLGVAVDAENIQKTTSAGIDNNASLNAVGAVNVDAASEEVINSYTGAVGLGVVGGAGTSADYQTNPINTTTKAYVNASSLNGGSLGVDAHENLGLTAISGEVSGGGLAFGAATALLKATPTTSASVSGGSVKLSSTGALSVTSGYTSTLTGTAAAGSGGTYVGNAAVATLEDDGTNTATLNATIPQSGAVTVNATTDRTLQGTTGSLSVSGLGVGASVVNTTLGGSTTAAASGNLGQTAAEFVQGLTVAASDTDTGTSTVNAIAAGIGNGQFNQAATSVGGTVKAQIADGSLINVNGNLGLNASAMDSASSTANGLGVGGFSVGESFSTATVSPTVAALIGANANLSAGQTISIGAAFNYGGGTPSTANTAAAEATSSVGALVATAGASSSATSGPILQVSVGNGSSIAAANNLSLDSLSSSLVNSDANGNAYSVANFSTEGGTSSTSTINNNNTIVTGSGATLTAGNNLTLSAQSTNNISNAKSEGTQAGILSLSNNTTTSTAALTDVTSTMIGGSGQLTAGPNGTVLIQALANNTANSNATDYAGNAFGGTNTATANTNVNTGNTTEVGANSNVQGGTVALDAEVTNEQYTATAISNTYTLHSDATANSNVEVTANVNANVDGGATLTAGNAITIKADQENLVGNSSARGKVVGAAGAPTANSDDNLKDTSNVNIASGATLKSDNVSIEALAPYDKGASYKQTASAQGDTAVVWVTQVVEEVVNEVFGWIPFVGDLVRSVTKWVTETVQKILDSDPTANQTGAFNPVNNITMNGTIVQAGGINPTLVASNVGGVPKLTTDVNVDATITGNTITVNDLLNKVQPTVSFNAPNGTLQGTFAVQRNTTWSAVNITNNTGDNLIINGIDPTTAANLNSPDLSIVAANNLANYQFVVTNTGVTAVNIQNNSASNITLQGLINNPAGIINIGDTVGNINATATEMLKATGTTLNANAGSVGSSANYLNVQMTSEDSNGSTLAVTAGGDAFLNARLVQDVANTAPASLAGTATITSIQTGGAANLNLLQPQAIVYSVNPGPPAVLVVTPTNAAGGYAIDAITGGTGATVNQTAGTMNVGTVASTNGNVNLNAQSGDIDLGTVNANKGTATLNASGSILDTNKTAASDVNAVNLNLTASGGSIGTDADPLNINSSVSSAGKVIAAANQGVYLNETAGDLNLGTVRSTTGDAILTADGSILDTNTTTASSITANNITLTATHGSIGGTTPTTLEITAAGQLTGNANQNVNITQTTGSMNVNIVNAANGNATLAATAGDIDLGTVNSKAGTASLSASGSVIDPRTPAGASDINAITLNLSATNGSIGTSAADPLNITSSYNGTPGQVTASGKLGVYLNQVVGNLNLGTVTSTAGDAVLTAANSILDTNSTAVSSVTAKNVVLTATSGSLGGTTVGTLEIDAAAQLTASANQNVNITQTTGPMNVNTVTASNGSANLTATAGDVDLGTVNAKAGNASITASGSVQDINTIGASSINAINVNLIAQTGSIGGNATAGSTLDLNAGGQLTATANQNANITQTTGATKVATVTATNGNVNLTAAAGDVDLGTVNAKKGDITILASGSILNASGGSASSVNLTGNNITLTATNGTIGLSTAPLFVNNQNPTTVTNGVPDGKNYLNASAYGDDFITEAQGNLLSKNLSSATGNVGITVLNGSEQLNQLMANQNVNLLVKGSLLSIGTITGSLGIPGVKAASPNNVTLTVAQAGGTLKVGNMNVFQSVTTQADNTTLSDVYVTNLSNPQLVQDHQSQSLHFSTTGYNGGIANSISVNVLPCSGCSTSPAVIFDKYWTKTGTVTASMDWLEFISGEVTGSAALQNAWQVFNLTSKKGSTSSWYLFVIGDKFARNLDPYENLSPAKFLQLPNHYTWAQDPSLVFPYLLSAYHFQ